MADLVVGGVVYPTWLYTACRQATHFRNHGKYLLVKRASEAQADVAIFQNKYPENYWKKDACSFKQFHFFFAARYQMVYTSGTTGGL